MPVGRDDTPALHDDGSLLDLPGRIVTRLAAILISALGFLRATVEPYVQSTLHHALWDHPNNPLSPSEAAVGFLKGAIDGDAARDEARLSGTDFARFDALVQMSGNPPGPESLLDLWRRGIIDEARFIRGLRQGLLRNDWIDTYVDRRFDPLTPHAYLQGAVEGHLPLDEAITKAGHLGLKPDDAELVYKTLGNPPGIVEMLHLMNRGEVTPDEVRQAIRESHYRDKYIEPLMHYGEYWPPPRTITTLLSHGAVDEAFADKLFRAAGLSPELAKAYVASALHVKTASHKELTVSTVSQLYTDHLLNREQALADLARVGYAGPEANLLLDLADAKVKQKIRQEAINGIRHVFLARRMDEATARKDLSQFQVDAGQIDGLIELWTLQRLIPSQHLTIGQLNQALKKDVIDVATFLQRAVDLGYTPGDAQILAAIDLA